MVVELWSNNEMLPIKKKPQKGLYLVLPTLGKWYVGLSTKVGKKTTTILYAVNIHYSFVLFGFGLVLTVCWDE